MRKTTALTWAGGRRWRNVGEDGGREKEMVKGGSAVGCSMESLAAVAERRAAAVRNALAATNAALFKCPRCGATGDPYDGFCRRCGHLLHRDKMLKRADELIGRELRRRTPRGIKGLAYIRGGGRIDLEVGKRGIGSGMDYGSGLAKLLQKHPEDIKRLGMTLILGKTCAAEEDRLARVCGDHVAALGRRPKGASVITHYKDAGKAARLEGISLWVLFCTWP